MTLTSQQRTMVYAARDEWLKCQKSAIYFIRRHCKIKDQLKGEVINFDLWPSQREQLRVWWHNEKSISLKARQLGISTLAGAYALHQALFNKFFEIMILSIKESRAIDFLDRVKFMYENLPDIFRHIRPLKSSNRLMMEFKNGSKIQSESTNPEAGRSTTLNLIIFDEAAFIENAERIYTAAKPTLQNTKGKIILISTANGYDEFFHPIWKLAGNGRNDYKTFFSGWQANPTRDEAWYEKELTEARESGKEPEFRQEFPNNADEAFIVSGRTVFDTEMIQRLMDRKPAEYQRGYLDKVNRFHEDNNGMLKIYEMPKRGQSYVIGADIAEGLEKGDNSVAVVYSRNPRGASYYQVAEYVGKIDTDRFGDDLIQLGYFYNRALLCPEMNSCGESMMHKLTKERHYPRIFRQMRYDERSKKKVKKLGWKTTRSSKKLMIDALIAGLRDTTLIPLSQEAVAEFRTFVRIDAVMGDGTRMAASGNNLDDRVIAHALCAVMLEETETKPPKRRNTIYKGKSRFQGKPKKFTGYDKSKVLN